MVWGNQSSVMEFKPILITSHNTLSWQKYMLSTWIILTHMSEAGMALKVLFYFFYFFAVAREHKKTKIQQHKCQMYPHVQCSCNTLSFGKPKTPWFVNIEYIDCSTILFSKLTCHYLCIVDEKTLSRWQNAVWCVLFV